MCRGNIVFRAGLEVRKTCYQVKHKTYWLSGEILKHFSNRKFSKMVNYGAPVPESNPFDWWLSMWKLPHLTQYIYMLARGTKQCFSFTSYSAIHSSHFTIYKSSSSYPHSISPPPQNKTYYYPLLEFSTKI